MTEILSLSATADVLSNGLPLMAAAVAAMLLLLGGLGLVSQRDRAAARIRALGADAPNHGAAGLSRTPSADPRGLARALIPEDRAQRDAVQRQLAALGLTQPDAVQNFYLLRLCLAVAPILLVGAAIVGAGADLLPGSASDAVRDMPGIFLAQIAAIGAACGFWGPGAWLKGRHRARIVRLRRALPNVLDLMQVSVQAGLGFDAALTRVGTELTEAAPDMARELFVLQKEISAGRDRETALFDMADRMGFEEAMSFALVITQSMQYGTSLTQALRAYAVEMRQARELEAQEKANRLPVQISAVMSFLMLPALFLITLTPIIIRYIGIE
ncbi:Bacterial type II secretion system protein F domain protein [Roseivivax jejudonensis]|uniref:Bacterial type II secretion system protein F domain protein n=1 Tax=Roseivivax jejudonensis TaxID=1529041 RepID=A0A1X6ZDD1_9RHOB|nr:type II secretion system F family protein [Roseivivax jejudonensis]SLN46454.1 Bacterial type II secretion system protein F domain protein [Roseivivax jejudonensis]